MHAVLSFLAAAAIAHQGELILLALGAVMAIVAHLPPRIAAMPLVGLLVRFVDRLSVLCHAQDPGTLKLPGVASLAFRAALEEAARATLPPKGAN